MKQGSPQISNQLVNPTDPFLPDVPVIFDSASLARVVTSLFKRTRILRICLALSKYMLVL